MALALLLAGCATPQGNPSPPASRSAAAGPQAFRGIEPSAGPADRFELSCPARLQEALAAGRITGLAIEWRGDPRLVERDLPAPDAGRGSRCLVVVDDIRLGQAELEAIGMQELEGRRRSGTRLRPNPRHRELERRLAALKKGTRRSVPRVMRTGDASLDLIGLFAGAVLSGLSAFGRGSAEVRALEKELADTPERIEEPVFDRYRYRVIRYRGLRTGRVRVALLDTEKGFGWTGTVRLAETARFAVAEGRAAGDPDPLPVELGHPADREALRSWKKTPPRIRLSRLLRHLSQIAAGRPEFIDHRTLLRLWSKEVPAAGPATADDGAVPEPARSASVVRLLRGHEAVGLGFYVRPDLIVTLAAFLPSSELIPVEVASDLVSYGIVEARDPRSGLVLVWLPRRGRPIPLDGRRAPAGKRRLLLPPEGDGPRAGAPLVAGDRLLGVWLGDDAWVPAGRVADLLSRAERSAIASSSTGRVPASRE